MADENGGSDKSGSPPNGGTGDKGGGDGSPVNLNAGAVQDFFKAASPEALEVFKANGFDKVETPQAFFDTVSKSYKDLSSKLGSVPSIPKADATDEDWGKFVDAVRPKDVTAYQFKLPEGLPKDFAYDSDFAKSFQAFAHEQGMHPRHAAAMHDWYVKSAGGKFQASSEQVETEVGNSARELQKDWGNPDSQSYKENLEYTRRAIKALGGEKLSGEMARLGVITANGDVRSPVLVRALATVGAMLFKEDGMVPDNNQGGVPGGDNPFKTGSVNTTKQGQIIKQNPELAKQLIREAGIDPKEYRL